MKVSVIAVHALVDAIEESGAPSEALLASAGISRPSLVDSSGWIDAACFDRLIEAALLSTGDAAFGIHWGERTTHAKWDVVSMFVTSAPSLRTAIEGVIRFHRILVESPELVLLEDGQEAVLRLQPAGLTETSRRVVAEMTLVALARMLRHFSGRDGAPHRVYLEYPSPPYAPEYGRVFGGVQRFSHAFTGIAFDASLLERPQLAWNADLFEMVRTQAEKALSLRSAEPEFARRLRNYLVQVFPARPDMKTAARGLGTSERSLRRRLVDEGVSYPALLAEVHVGIAKRLLGEETRSVQEIAYAMGFSSPAAFHRAFKRWTGVSPSLFKRDTRGGDHDAPKA